MFTETSLRRRGLQQWALKDSAFHSNSQPRLRQQTSASAPIAQTNQLSTHCLAAVTEKPFRITINYIVSQFFDYVSSLLILICDYFLTFGYVFVANGCILCVCSGIFSRTVS